MADSDQPKETKESAPDKPLLRVIPGGLGAKPKSPEGRPPEPRAEEPLHDLIERTNKVTNERDALQAENARLRQEQVVERMTLEAVVNHYKEKAAQSQAEAEYYKEQYDLLKRAHEESQQNPDRSPWRAKNEKGWSIDIAELKDSERALSVREARERELHERSLQVIIEEIEKTARQRGIFGGLKRLIKGFWDYLTEGTQLKDSVAYIGRALSLTLVGNDPTVQGMNEIGTQLSLEAFSLAATSEEDLKQQAVRAPLLHEGEIGELAATARFFKRMSVEDEKQREARLLADIEIARHSGMLFEYTTTETETLWSVLYRTHDLAMKDFHNEPLPQYKRQFLVAYMVRRVHDMSPEQRKELFGVDDVDHIPPGTTINLEGFYKTGAWHYALDMLSQLSDEQRNELSERYAEGTIAQARGTYDAAENYLPNEPGLEIPNSLEDVVKDLNSKGGLAQE